MSEFFERVVYAMLEAEADLDPMSARTALIAALKAMREPPFTAYADADALNDSYWPGKAPVHAVWQAMIDQAIKEGE